MDMEAGKTLTNEEVIRELLELLKKNAMKEQANDVILSILVDTFISKISFPMQPGPEIGSISDA